MEFLNEISTCRPYSTYIALTLPHTPREETRDLRLPMRGSMCAQPAHVAPEHAEKWVVTTPLSRTHEPHLERKTSVSANETYQH